MVILLDVFNSVEANCNEPLTTIITDSTISVNKKIDTLRGGIGDVTRDFRREDFIRVDITVVTIVVFNFALVHFLLDGYFHLTNSSHSN